MNPEVNLSERVKQICARNFAADLKITALKEVRSVTGLSLMHSKLLVEHEWLALQVQIQMLEMKEKNEWETKGRDRGWL